MLTDNQVTGFRRRPWAGSAKVNHKTSHPFKYSQNKRGIESRFSFTSNLQGMIEKVGEIHRAGLSGIYVDEYQLSIPEWRVIANLAEHNTPNARQIAAFTTMEKSKVSRAVASPSERCLIIQKRAEGDSRATNLALTDEGGLSIAVLFPGCWIGSGHY